MFLARRFLTPGVEAEDDLAEITHLLEKFFEPAVIGDGLCKEAGLCLRQSQGGSLSLNFSSQAPGVELFVHQATLSDPT